MPRVDGGPRAQRGSLTVAAGVVEKIAAAAAHRVRGVRPVSPGVVGRVLRSGEEVQVSARVLGTTATVTLKVGVAYPGPVRQVCREVRAEVARQLSDLAGVELGTLDVEVVELPSARSVGPPRVR